MKKFVQILMILIGMIIGLPVLKMIMDIFTDPATGILITSGVVPDYLIALFTALPWLGWPAGIIWIIFILVKKEEPKDNFPRIIQ
jgi:hypothetical protein